MVMDSNGCLFSILDAGLEIAQGIVEFLFRAIGIDTGGSGTSYLIVIIAMALFFATAFCVLNAFFG
jgi:hypothetical protein